MKISILLDFPGQVVLPGAINFCVCHIRNEDVSIFVQDESSVAQKLEGFRCLRDSRGVRYYVLTHCSLSAQFCMSIHFIFLRSSFLLGVPDAGSTAVGWSQVDAQAVTTLTSVCVSLKKTKLFPESLNSRAGRPHSWCLVMNLLRSVWCFHPLGLDRLCRVL